MSDLQPFFFRAMKSGYIVDPPIIATLNDLPGSKSITFKEPDGFHLIDYWFNGLEGRGAGSITIFAGDEAVWRMNFHGFYNKPVIPFLKEALASEYMKPNPIPRFPEQFLGCRGPRIYQKGPLIYVNNPRPGSTFSDFSGREEIFGGTNHTVCCGFHKYYGYALW